MFEERARVDGVNVRSYYHGFKHVDGKGPSTQFPIKPEGLYEIVLHDGPSIFDEQHPSLPAQCANEDGYPEKKWVNVKTTLSEIDTTQLHYVKVPENHIVIDFDLVDETATKISSAIFRKPRSGPLPTLKLAKADTAFIFITYIPETLENLLRYILQASRSRRFLVIALFDGSLP